MKIPNRSALAILVALVCCYPAQGLAQHSPLGTNLVRIDDWSTDFPLLDVFKTSRPWISNTASRQPDTRPLDVDAHGWVRYLQSNQIATTLLFWDLSRTPGRYPAGRYVVTYEGEGTLAYGGSAVRVETRPGRDVIDVDPGSESSVVGLRGRLLYSRPNRGAGPDKVRPTGTGECVGRTS